MPVSGPHTGDMTSTRNDIHRAASADFDPANYDCFGVFDLATGAADYVPDNRVEVVSGLVAKGWSFAGAPHGSGQCSHCGTRIRYGALMGYTETKGLLWIGETCLDNRFSLDLAEFQALREATAAKREASKSGERLLAQLIEQPALVWASYAWNIAAAGSVYETDEYSNYSYAKPGTSWEDRTRFGEKTSTLSDMWNRFVKYGTLSEKAYGYLQKILVWQSEAEARLVAQQAEKDALVSTGVAHIAGRQVIEGVVLSTKQVEGQFGFTTKMLVQADNGLKFWGTMPASVNAEKGDRVRLTGTVEPSKDDVLFAFYSRPAKAEVVAQVAAA